MALENTNPQVRREGLVTNKAATFGSTLTVSGAVSFATTLAVTGALTLSAALTGTTGYFSGVLSAPGSVSTTKIVSHTNALELPGSVSSSQISTYGSAVLEIGKSGNTVSSVAINIAGVVGQDITASSNPSIANATSTLKGIGGIELVSRHTGYVFCLSVTSVDYGQRASVLLDAGDCPW